MKGSQLGMAAERNGKKRGRRAERREGEPIAHGNGQEGRS